MASVLTTTSTSKSFSPCVSHILLCVLLLVVLFVLETKASRNDADEVGNKNSLSMELEQARQGPSNTNKVDTDRKGPIMVCGNKDEEGIDHNGRRQKRYAVARFADGKVNKWMTTDLTWAIVDPSRQIDVHKQRRVIRESLQVWSDVSPLTFRMVNANDNPDISVRFARRRHGPAYDPVFDGRASVNSANIFGHAWGPGEERKGIAGDVHLDEDDDWSIDHKLKGVLVHELGHSMGLSHSDDPEAIMFAIYREATELANDDIRGIQSLYGSRRGSNRRVTVRPLPRPTPRPQRPRTRRPIATRKPYRPYVTVAPEVPPTLRPDSPCLANDINGVVEDQFSVIKGLYYVFIGDTVHHIMFDGTHVGTMDLKRDFPGVPKNPDVVFSVQGKKSIFFIKGNQRWEFTIDGLTKDSPQSIRHMNFPEQPKYTISLFDVEGQQRLYFFGKRYWWSFYLEHPRPTQHYEIEKFSRDLPSEVTFVTKWADDRLYVVSRDSYIIMDISRRAKTHDRPIMGKPYWLNPLCSGCTTLPKQTSLLAVGLISLISWFQKRLL